MKFSSLKEALRDAHDEHVMAALRILNPTPSSCDADGVIEVKQGQAWTKSALDELVAVATQEVLLMERPTVLVGKTAANRWPIDALIIGLAEHPQD